MTSSMQYTLRVQNKKNSKADNFRIFLRFVHEIVREKGTSPSTTTVVLIASPLTVWLVSGCQANTNFDHCLHTESTKLWKSAVRGEIL